MIGSEPHWEIERKYHIDRFPDEREGWPQVAHVMMEQAYLATNPTVRIRSAIGDGEECYWLCFKGKGRLKRREIEMPISKQQFEELCDLLTAIPIRKELKVYQLPDGHRLECSRVDEGTETEFYYAEVEFDSVEESEAFVAPPFVGEDATNESGFSMAAYWRRTRCGR
ncbi:MAG: hypothetical protein IK954_07745 [Clostridia bacterium]|nr:hypothetical protein [Clostridia bacterium]